MQTQRAARAFGLALLLALSTVAAPASAQDVVQDPKQPSVDNPHMHFWGDSGLNNCWTISMVTTHRVQPVRDLEKVR